MSFLLLDSTLVDDKYLENLEMASELIVCTVDQVFKLSIYFDIKR